MLSSSKARAEQKGRRNVSDFIRARIFDGERSLKCFPSFSFLDPMKGSMKNMQTRVWDAHWTFSPFHSEFVQNTIVKNWVSSFIFLVEFPWDVPLKWRHNNPRSTKNILNMSLFYKILSTTNKNGSCFSFIIFPDWFLMEGEIRNSETSASLVFFFHVLAMLLLM